MSLIDTDTKMLAQQILRYLESHPDATDSAEGIAMWWIPQQRYIETIEKVTMTLEYMFAKGLITRMTLSDGRVIYTVKEKSDNNLDVLN